MGRALRHPAARIDGVLFGPVFEEFREVGIIARADHDLQRDVLVAGYFFALPLAMNASSAQPQPRAGGGAFRDRHRYGPGDGRHRHARAEQGFGKAGRQFQMNVVALAAKEGMRRDMHLDQRIARRAAAKAWTAFALEAQDLALLDSGRDREVEPFVRRQGQALLAAGRRRDEVDGQRVVTIGAGHRKPLAASPAPRTTARASPLPAAAEHLEQIIEIAHIHLAAVVAGAFLRVGQDVVRGRDRLETRLGGRLPGVQIGVKLLGELAVRLADLLGGGVRLDAEHLIGGLRRHQRVCRGSLPRGRVGFGFELVFAVAVAASMRTGTLTSEPRRSTVSVTWSPMRARPIMLRNCVPLWTVVPLAATTRSPVRSPACSAGEPVSTRAMTAPSVGWVLMAFANSGVRSWSATAI